MKDNKYSFKNIFKRETKLATYIIAVTTILVIGLSYALFFQVNSNSGNQVVKSGDLAFTYSKDGTVLPDNDTTLAITDERCFYPMNEADANALSSTCSYQFSIQNTGTLDAAYTVYLKATESNTANPAHLKVILRQSDGTTFNQLTGYPKTINSLTNEVLLTGDLGKNDPILVYSIQIYLDEALADDADYQSKVISYKLEGKSVVHEDQGINTELPPSDATLAKIQQLNPSIVVNESMNGSTGVCPTYDATTKTVLTTAGERSASLLCEAEDDYGTTYYFRGNVENNYVSFAGSIWRIIRINGDGSLRIIKTEKIGESIFSNNHSTLYGENADAGYMHKGINQLSYADTFDVMNNKNATSSTLKTTIDTWYANNILNTNYHDYVNDTLFCNDKNFSSNESLSNPGGYYSTDTEYRWSEFPWTTSYHGIQYPRLICTNTTGLVDSRNDAYTVSDNVHGNAALTYPIAALTLDEVIVSGGWEKGMHDSGQTYLSFLTVSHSLSAYEFFDVGVWAHGVYGGAIDTDDEYTVNSQLDVYPVLNLKPSVNFTGTGTSSDPFTVVY